MATWECFRVPPDNKQYLSLKRVIDIAKEAGGNNHGFKFIQLPYNMHMIQALTLKNNKIQEKHITILDAAKELGIGVFTSVPLMQGKLLSSDLVPDFGELTKLSHSVLQFVRSTPGIIAPLVGHKTNEHVNENLKLIELPPLTDKEFDKVVNSLKKS